MFPAHEENNYDDGKFIKTHEKSIESKNCGFFDNLKKKQQIDSEYLKFNQTWFINVA